MEFCEPLIGVIFALLLRQPGGGKANQGPGKLVQATTHLFAQRVADRETKQGAERAREPNEQ